MILKNVQLAKVKSTQKYGSNYKKDLWKDVTKGFLKKTKDVEGQVYGDSGLTLDIKAISIGTDGKPLEYTDSYGTIMDKPKYRFKFIRERALDTYSLTYPFEMTKLHTTGKTSGQIDVQLYASEKSMISKINSKGQLFERIKEGRIIIEQEEKIKGKMVTVQRRIEPLEEQYAKKRYAKDDMDLPKKKSTKPKLKRSNTFTFSSQPKQSNKQSPPPVVKKKVSFGNLFTKNKENLKKGTQSLSNVFKSNKQSALPVIKKRVSLGNLFKKKT